MRMEGGVVHRDVSGNVPLSVRTAAAVTELDVSQPGYVTVAVRRGERIWRVRIVDSMPSGHYEACSLTVYGERGEAVDLGL